MLQCALDGSTMRKLGNGTVVISLRLEQKTIDGFKGMADAHNPFRAIMRDALNQYLRRLGKLAAD